MPELAASFFVGFLVSLTANLVHLFFVVKSYQSPAIINLQNNLQKVGKIWSMSNRAVMTVVGNSVENCLLAISEDRNRTLKGTALFSSMLVVTSWLGLIWLGLYVLSVHRLAKSRMEHKIFNSMLVTNSQLTREQVANLLSEMESLR